MRIDQRRLANGIDLAVLQIPGRPVANLEIRVFAGYAYEDERYLGVAHLVEETLSKGTARRDGRALNDAFDEIGATHASFTGRETLGFSSLCLPEFLPQTIALHGEMLSTPSFPDDACEVAVELALQSLSALQDDPSELTKKLIYAQAYGQPLGRHPLGERETLERTGREQIVAHWRRCFTPRRMQVAVAGAVDPTAVADQLEAAFSSLEASADSDEDEMCGLNIQFVPKYSHHEKELEQEQVALCFPGSSADDPDYYVQKVAIGILSGGMSGRLFTEVREKQGLVYWVGAWTDQPRVGGMVHVGASTTPENLDRTYETLIREVGRLADDLTQSELDRAIAGLVTRARTRGDVTRARAAEAVEDLFYYGRVIPTDEKLARISAVTIRDIRDYLAAHPRDRLSVVTLGPQKLANGRMA
ncbi:MAG TPA: pitrilysin family protein [Phycisphaerae bacterium]|nr:pitrilysin family protein [Phycisphaerae bacterium]HOJ72843.1 pitrilysin family protein [Phycisphaerae bacterium]HOM51730.1 pitrilysin family protein [Phycisphaerae bacterium]HON67620.1 pitrilysin family protein [Phycisphaerae bacterium]HOQ86946.1 pitrilysin family protein [Phycisphaerae bacterium]